MPRAPRSVYVLVAANLVPLVGVVAFGWSLGEVMLLFWAENAVIGVYHVLRIALATRLFALFLAPFFAVHYGAFTLVHGLFVVGLFVIGIHEGTEDLAPAFEAARTVALGVLVLFVSHGTSFVMNFLRGGEMARMRAAMSIFTTRKVAPGKWVSEARGADQLKHARGLMDAGELMTAPYRRVVLMHVTIMGGGFLLMLLGTPMPALLLLVVLKTVVDVRAHMRERTRGATVAVVEAATPA